MRRLLGLLLLLYGLVLAINTTVPYLAELTGKQVMAAEKGDAFICPAPLGTPPYAGIYGSCQVGWEGTDTGKVFGADVEAQVTKGKSAAAYQYPLLTDYAFLPTTTEQKVAGGLALLLIIVGIVLLVRRKKKRHGHHDHDSDDDSDDDDDGDSGSDSDSSDGGSSD